VIEAENLTKYSGAPDQKRPQGIERSGQDHRLFSQCAVLTGVHGETQRIQRQMIAVICRPPQAVPESRDTTWWNNPLRLGNPSAICLKASQDAHGSGFPGAVGSQESNDFVHPPPIMDPCGAKQGQSRRWEISHRIWKGYRFFTSILHKSGLKR
jgi:hypothetical protein